LRWATSGFGTTGHLILEQVRRATGARIVHIPYKGGGQQIQDALSGQFDLLSTNVGPSQRRYVESQRLKPLAVGAPHRLPGLPQVRTFAELGYPSANITSLFGLFAPSRTPRDRVDALNAALKTILASADFVAQVVGSDNLPAFGSTDEFSHLIKVDWQRNAAMIRQANIRDE
jgi:tripartite-type tricarboxylate transporter receptor subunit TctC